MAHPNARLTPATRLELVLEVEAGCRRRRLRGASGFLVRRSPSGGAATGRRARPGSETVRSASNPRRTAAALEQRICAVRRSQGFGPHRIAWALGARPTPCRRYRTLHRVSRRSLRAPRPRRPAADVKKLGRIPDGGHRVRGRSAATPRTRGLDYLHVAVDDHSRYAYVAVLPDERGPSCAAFLEQALAAFGRRGVRVRGVLTDNAKAYTVSRDFRRVAAAAGVALRHSPPPAANGKAERFIQPAERVGSPPLPLQRRAAARSRAPTATMPPATRRYRRGCPRP